MRDAPPLHVILGAGGAIGTPLAGELLARGERLRTVSRRGVGPTGADARAADLNDAGQVSGVIEEGSTVYLLAGLPYDHRAWAEQWPRIMRNVVAACEGRQARLIFFDNVYAYGNVDGPMTENTPLQPTSRKGRVRAEIAGYLQEEMAAGRIRASIARAADFYGPSAEKTGVPTILVIKRLAQGKAAQVFVNADTRHSYTYTSDCARALCLLADADDSMGQIWHLPTASPALTGRQFVEMTARLLGVAPRLTTLPRWLMTAGGVASPLMRELGEMLYQNEHDYVFDSSKFERRFVFVPTSYEEGIRATILATVGPPPPSGPRRPA